MNWTEAILAQPTQALLVCLILLALAVSAFDLRTRRVPNAVTLPLLAGGLLSFFAQDPPVASISANLLLSVLLLTGWQTGAFGGGDVKLWLALAWYMPPQFPATSWVFLGVLAGTAALQLAVRWLRGQMVCGVRTPSAWRAVPFLLIIFLAWRP